MLQMIRQTKHRKAWALLLVLPMMFMACEKNSLEPVETYPDPPVPLVKFLDGAPSPAIGSEGSIVNFNVTGLKGKEGQFTFYINQTEAEVVEVGENSIKVKVPANASSGGSAVLINGEYYFGPNFNVRGKIAIDPLFNPDAFRANGPIQGIIKRTDGTSYMIYGSFSDYKNQASVTNKITGIALLNADGDYLPVTSQLKMGNFGFNGNISSMTQLPDGKYLVSGNFSRYDTVGNINSITRLNADGTLDVMVAEVINPDPVANPNGGQAIVPAFNGGIRGGNGARTFYHAGTGKINAIGNFFSHVSTFYERSTKDGPFLDLVEARQLLRMDYNGAFDSTFNFDLATNKSYEGANGAILDAIQLADGKIIVVGNFSTFNGATVNNIVRISETNGAIDPSFNEAGTGADGRINRITYNKTTGKILLTGSFKHYNGQPVNGIVMINPNGQADPVFQFKSTEGGIPNFAGELNNGKILVTGSFTKYNGVVRPGMLILNPDGSLAAGYNNLGLFRGVVNDFVEMTSAGGVPAVMIVGNFDRFDNKEVGNIVKFRIEN